MKTETSLKNGNKFQINSFMILRQNICGTTHDEVGIAFELQRDKKIL